MIFKFICVNLCISAVKFFLENKSMAEILTQTGFDKLLATLDADREQAGAKYESLRVRLIKFFEWRNCEVAEELTDKVFDRVIKKIAEGEQIQNIAAYSATVAQFVFKEDCRRRERLFQSIEDAPEIANQRRKKTNLSKNLKLKMRGSIVWKNVWQNFPTKTAVWSSRITIRTSAR